MDNQVIRHKLVSLKRCVERIEEKTPEKPEDLQSHYDSQDIIILNLQRAVQISADLAAHILASCDSKVPTTMAESFEFLFEKKIISKRISERMQKSVGFRNIAIHEYTSLNWDLVYSIIKNHMGDFRKYASEIVEWMEKQHK